MALVTVQRSPSPSHSSNDLDESDVPTSSESSRHSGKPKNFSESYFAVKGAALILPKADLCKRKISKASHGGDIQNHLQAMFHLLRPQDTIQVAVKLESVYTHNRVRYFAVVSCIGRQDTDESVVLGVDYANEEKATVGLVLPIWANTKTSLNGDGGFTVSTANDRIHVFKPVTVQAMWSGLHILHKACDAATKCCYVPSGLTHTWISYYESKLASADPMAVGEWNLSDDLIAAARSGDATSSSRRLGEQEDTEQQIRSKLREIMIRVDLEDVTSVYLRECLEDKLGMNLKEYKSFIDTEMIIVMGQLDSPSHIFDFLFLGSEWNASNLDELNRNGIGFILNVTTEIDNFFPGLFKYHNVRVHDTEDTDLHKYWEATHKFILRAIDSKSKVLVHCKMGVSRSASTVIAFAMKQYNWSYEKAYDFVLARRSVVRPNDGFKRQLQLYEGILSASNNRHSALWRSKSESNLKQHSMPLHEITQDDSEGSGATTTCEGGSGAERMMDAASDDDEVLSLTAAARRPSQAQPNTAAVRPRSWSPHRIDKGLEGSGKEDRSDQDGGDSSNDNDSSTSDDDSLQGENEDTGYKGAASHSEYDLAEVQVGCSVNHRADSASILNPVSEVPLSSDVHICDDCNRSSTAAVALPNATTSPMPARPSALAVQAKLAAVRQLAEVEGAPDVKRGSGGSFMPLQGHSGQCASSRSPKMWPSGGRGEEATADAMICASLSVFGDVPLAPEGLCEGCSSLSAAGLAVRGHERTDLPPVQETAATTSQCQDRLDYSPACAVVATPTSLAAVPVPGETAQSPLDGIWKRYTLEDIPWSPGAVRRQKKMLECSRLSARKIEHQTDCCAATQSSTPAVGCSCAASGDCMSHASGIKDSSGALVIDGTDSIKPAPGTVRKVRKEIEDRLADDGAAGGCLIQRSASMKTLHVLREGKQLQRSASVRERLPATCRSWLLACGATARFETSNDTARRPSKHTGRGCSSSPIASSSHEKSFACQCSVSPPPVEVVSPSLDEGAPVVSEAVTFFLDSKRDIFKTLPGGACLRGGFTGATAATTAAFEKAQCAKSCAGKIAEGQGLELARLSAAVKDAPTDGFGSANGLMTFRGSSMQSRLPRTLASSVKDLVWIFETSRGGSGRERGHLWGSDERPLLRTQSVRLLPRGGCRQDGERVSVALRRQSSSAAGVGCATRSGGDSDHPSEPRLRCISDVFPSHVFDSSASSGTVFLQSSSRNFGSPSVRAPLHVTAQ